jgi:hypothetical protein
MTSNVKYLSPYDLRVKLVQDTMKKNSKLNDKASFELAVHVLDALDHVPEKLR